MSELELLRRLGDEITPPALDELRAIARKRDRARSWLLAATSAVAVAAVAVGAFLIDPDGGNSTPEPAPAPEERTTRPLTYADGTAIHHGDATIEAPSRVVELDLTDEGVAFRTADGRLWFADGSSVEELGAVGDPGPAYGPDSWPLLWMPSWMVSGNAGSRLAWFEFVRPGEPEVVVYDTRAREIVTRTAVDVGDGGWAAPYSVDEESAYWFLDPDELADANVPQVRLDLTTNTQATVTAEDYLAGLGRGAARTFEVSHAERDSGSPRSPTARGGTSASGAAGSSRRGCSPWRSGTV